MIRLLVFDHSDDVIIIIIILGRLPKSKLGQFIKRTQILYAQIRIKIMRFRPYTDCTGLDPAPDRIRTQSLVLPGLLLLGPTHRNTPASLYTQPAPLLRRNFVIYVQIFNDRYIHLSLFPPTAWQLASSKSQPSTVNFSSDGSPCTMPLNVPST